MLALLRSLSGRAVVIVTHEPDAAAIADRVLQLRCGSVDLHAAGQGAAEATATIH